MPLTAKLAGTTLSGECRKIIFESQSTEKIESTAEAAIIDGRVVTSKLVRNNASRVAFPATCCAIIAAEATAMTTAPAGSGSFTDARGGSLDLERFIRVPRRALDALPCRYPQPTAE